MHEELYAKLPSVDAYLERIGFDGPREPTVEVLDALIDAHLKAIPFENIDIVEEGYEPSLAIPTLFDRMVAHRRGGYCFELNALFQALLTELGFECYSVVCRILFVDLVPRHRGIVAVVDGKHRYVDVGLAGPIATASLLMEPGLVQHTSGGDFCFERDGDMWAIVKQGETTMRTVGFFDVPAIPEDFIPINSYVARGNTGKMWRQYVLSLFTERGYVSIDGDVFAEKVDGVVTKREIDAKETQRLARERFGIER